MLLKEFININKRYLKLILYDEKLKYDFIKLNIFLKYKLPAADCNLSLPSTAGSAATERTASSAESSEPSATASTIAAASTESAHSAIKYKTS